MSSKDQKEKFNQQRRTLLTAAGSGAVGFVLGKVLGPRINLFSQDYTLSEKDFKNFRVVETNKEMRLYDRNGNEIFIVDKESFRE